MLNLRQLQHVRALAEHAHFGRAARAVHLSQPAFTRSIQALETHLQVTLFDRGQGGIRPTVFGRLLLERGAQIVHQSRQLEKEIRQLRGLDSGQVAVGAGPYPAASLLPTVTGRLVSAHPGLRVRVMIDNWRGLTRLLREGELDLFVADIRELAGAGDLDITPMPSHRTVFFCRPGHPLLALPRLDADSLAQYPLAGTEIPQNLGEGFGALDEDYTVVSDDALFLRALVAASDVISVAPRSTIAGQLARGELVELPVKDTPAYASAYGIVRLAGQTPSPAAQAVRAELLRVEEELSE